MYQDAEAHSAAVRKEIDAELAQKYRDGQKTHGGELWRKTGLLAHAIDEAHDLETYLVTLRQQISEMAGNLQQAMCAEVFRQAPADVQSIFIAAMLRTWLLEKND